MRAIFTGATHTLPSASPLFLQLLADALAGPSEPPFPLLEHLSFILVAPTRCLPQFSSSGTTAGDDEGWGACARALCDASRYPRFARVSMRVDEPTYLMSLFRDQSARSLGTLKDIEEMLGGFKKAGKQVEVTMRRV